MVSCFYIIPNSYKIPKQKISLKSEVFLETNGPIGDTYLHS